MRIRDSTLGFLMVVPILILVFGLIAYPFIYGIHLSLCKKFVGYPSKFVGLKNYIKLYHDGIFRRTVKNTIIYTTGAVSIKLIFGMIMALVLNQQIKSRNFFRGVLLIPWIAPYVVTSLAWLYMFDALKGVVNLSLMKAGIIQSPVPWLSHPKLAMASVTWVNIWRGFPFFGVAILAGLQSIPRSLYEAAEVDGASSIQKFIHVTLPGIKIPLAIATLLSTIWTFNDFANVFLMTRGGPGGATQIFATLSYEIGFEGMRWGEAVAVSLYPLPVFALIIILLARYLRRE
jgi:multiple sugar transport system permease protein